MELSERPSVENGNSRQLDFAKVKWLTKAKFEEMLMSRTDISPCLNEREDRMERRIFVGKTIPKQPVTSSSMYRPSFIEASLSLENIEQIGNVVYENKAWKLRVTFRGTSFDIEDSFLVLHIPDKSSFYWQSNLEQPKGQRVPMYALKASMDQLEKSYFYIGRTMSVKDTPIKHPKYYSGGWYYVDDENAPQVFGKVSKTYQLLFAPFTNIEIGHAQFEILCLKASPASLKTLCQTNIRSYVGRSQKRIKRLGDSIPTNLVNFLKYPAYLRVGDFMLKGEKIVDERDEIELELEESSGNLVCKLADERSSSTPLKLLASDIDAIWLHRFNTVLTNRDTAQVQHSIYDNLFGYKLFLDSEKFNTKIRFSVQI